VAGRVFKSNRLLIFHDIENDPHFQKEMRLTYRQNNLKTALGIPLMREKKCAGALTVFFQKKIAFNHEQKCFFSTLGKHLAVSMHIGEIFRKLNYQKTKLERMAHRDSQTGLPNHRSLQTMLKKSLAETYRYNNNLSVLMVDIDNFKEINDNYGHLFGDRILKNIAKIFQENTRSADTVGRFGGDEFLFILPETGIEKGQQLAERLLRSVEKSGVKNDDEEIKATISIGLSSIGPTNEKISPADLIDQADLALYEAKKRGRNCLVKYED
jgi:diguanylate cyclase (GGDEF)-like protein